MSNRSIQLTQNYMVGSVVNTSRGIPSGSRVPRFTKKTRHSCEPPDSVVRSGFSMPCQNSSETNKQKKSACRTHEGLSPFVGWYRSLNVGSTVIHSY